MTPPAGKVIHTLVADSNQMQRQLLVAALRRHPEFHVIACDANTQAILHAVAEHPFQVALIHPETDITALRSLHLAHPEVAKILLLDVSSRDAIVQALRAGARGLFCFADSPFRLLCRCIQRVYQGQIWLSNQQLEYLIETVGQVPALRVVNSHGANLLTPREEQVVALVADGLTNRDVARELGLSEHTVKKYLFRIFDKVGVSSRVELVLYAVTRSSARQAEWIPA